MKQLPLIAMLGFSTLAHADLRSDISALCAADSKTTPAECDCQVNTILADTTIDRKFMNATVEGVKGNTEPLMTLMQNDQEGANRFGERMKKITQECGAKHGPK